MDTNIKPRLRELAARSERVVEFALVRDANGQLVESDGGSAVGTALKVGAGAAALGGAGYGGYKAYQYGKGQVIGQGYSQYRNGLNGGMPASFAKQAADADFANLGKVGGAKAAFSAAGSAAKAGVQNWGSQVKAAEAAAIKAGTLDPKKYGFLGKGLMGLAKFAKGIR